MDLKQKEYESALDTQITRTLQKYGVILLEMFLQNCKCHPHPLRLSLIRLG